MKRFIKRLNCLLCTIVIIAVTTLSAPLKAQATAIPGAVGSEATIEALMVLWNLVMNSFVASGAVEAVADYDTEKSIMDAFMDIIDPLEAQQKQYFSVVTSSGEILTCDDLIEAYEKGTATLPEWWVDEWDVDEETGEDVITLPNEQAWGKYRVGWGDDFASILEAWEERGGGTGDNGEPEEPKEPEFSRLKTFAITGGFLAMIGDFVGKVFNGEVEGVEPEKIFETNGNYTYDGRLQMNSAGEYIVQGESVNIGYDYSGKAVHKRYVFVDCVSNTPVAAYFKASSSFYNDTIGQCYVTFKTVKDGKLDYFKIKQQYHTYNLTGELMGTQTHESLNYMNITSTKLSELSYTLNVPLFSSEEEVNNFLLYGDETGVINRLYFYDSVLISSMPAVIAPMANMQLSPSVLQSTYTGMKNAYETEIKANASTDAATNTQTYTETMKDVVTETVPQYTPTPEPAPEPDAPTVDNDTETGVEEIDNYKRDLRMLFPFCLPFDFIALLQALDAEPETPYFEIPFVVPALDIDMSVALDLSFLDDVMDGLRKFELVGFIVFLIFATGKLIKW